MSSEIPMIHVEHLGKSYQIDHLVPRPTQLREVLGSSLQRMMRGFRRSTLLEAGNGRHETFWALKEISFDVQQGDRLGIIGRNGAGKSTLLKILSRITEPTEGQARIRGRIASLLEVGTGFHPELTGRENIFLNGAILGMSRKEIEKKFDEIVAFAEVEKFIDTPVKRYSSGMYVRLAFSVAAHLEPEILLIDEVLAVGDMKFQQKCLGKMKQATGEGRTVLFVTHQMGMVAQLCNKALLLQEGRITSFGKTEEVVASYLKTLSDPGQARFTRSGSAESGKDMSLIEAETLTAAGVPAVQFSHEEPIGLKIRGGIQCGRDGAVLGFVVKDRLGRRVFTSQVVLEEYGIRGSGSEFTAWIRIPGDFLTPGDYTILIALHIPNVESLDAVDDVCRFSIIDTGSAISLHEGADYGCVFAKCEWQVQKNA